MPTPHSIVTIVGSLRKGSFTLKIANALAKLAPASLKLDVTTLHGISFFNTPGIERLYSGVTNSTPLDFCNFSRNASQSAGGAASKS